MDSYSTQTLLQFFEGTTEWRRKLDSVHEEAIIPWTEAHLSAVCAYILKLRNINSEFKLLKKVPSGSHISREVVTSFMQELQEFFIVPKPHQLYDKDKATALGETEILAVFINFLLHLLYHKTEFIDSFGDKIEVLKKELRFLLSFLGDTSLLGVELQEVNNLLEELEDVANEAGSFVFSFIFTMDRAIMARTMDEDSGALLERINLLKGKITTFSFLIPNIRKANITSKTASVDSLFIVDSLLYDLEDLINREDDRIADVKGQIEILRQGLKLFKSLLKDIRVLQHSEILELKGIVMQIRDVAYETEYLINSFLAGDYPPWYFTFRLPDVTRKIKLIVTELPEIKKSFDIGALEVAIDYSSQLSTQAKTNSKVDDIIVGLEDEATHILELFEGVTEHLQIITIFGMPGLGKTTLAKKLYNHPRASYYFDRHSWCVVSQTYQRKNLLIDILISLGSEPEKVEILDMEGESLVERIYKSLKGRRYLIVMDDVWDSNVWNDLRTYFPDDGNGSRILFTSRNKDVAPPNSIIYALPPLSNGQCWELLQKKVFHNKPCPPKLLRIGRSIAANCNGLPLAVVVIAGILSTMDKEESTWERIRASLGSYIFSDENNSMMQVLKLSYKHIPNHLKPCFLYFGAFSEDYEIPANKLKCLWIAEGFVCREENKIAENVAEDYLMELIDRSLVIVAKRRSDGGAKTCVVHDLLRDMCLRIAEEENFLKLTDDDNSIYTKHHRLHVHNKPQYPMALRFGPHLRSLIASRLDSLPLNIFDMKLLRVLLGFSHVDGIEHLINLRCLAIEYIPASIDSLVNLEFLTVQKLLIYGGQRSIPSVIQNMVKLRYLRVPLAKFDEEWNISKTNNLEFLSKVKIYELKDEEKLRCLPHLRRLKCQCQLFWDEKGVYRFPDFRFLTQLESLNMTISFDFLAEINFPVEIIFLAEINFPANIKKLSLEGMWLPWEKMAVIGGLPNLQVLKLRFDAFVGEVWETRDGEFQQLRFLKIYRLNLVKWSVDSSEHFPKLQYLMLRDCMYLEEIPSEVGEIATLQSIEVKECPKSVGESAIRIQEEQRELGNEKFRAAIVKST